MMEKIDQNLSLFFKLYERIICINNLLDLQIEIIQKVCNKLKIAYDNKCLDFLDDRNYSIFISLLIAIFIYILMKNGNTVNI